MTTVRSPFDWNTGEPSIMLSEKQQKAIKQAVKHTKTHVHEPIKKRQPMVPLPPKGKDHGKD